MSNNYSLNKQPVKGSVLAATFRNDYFDRNWKYYNSIFVIPYIDNISCY